MHAVESEGSWYMLLSTGLRNDSRILESPHFGPGNGTRRQLHFLYHIFSTTGDHESVVELQYCSTGCSPSLGWITLWVAPPASPIDLWRHAVVDLPTEAQALRFEGKAVLDPAIFRDHGPDFAVDGIGVGIPTVDVEALSCNFEQDGCLWFEVGNSTWQRVNDTDPFGMPLANEGSHFLQAVGTGEERSISESAPFSAARDSTNSTALHFAFQVFGDAVLEVQAWSEVSGWTSAFMTGTQQLAWKPVMVSLPQGTVSVRLIAAFAATGNVPNIVRIDSLILGPAVASMESASCSFEDVCGWSGIGPGASPWWSHSSSPPNASSWSWESSSPPEGERAAGVPEGGFRSNSYVYVGESFSGRFFRSEAVGLGACRFKKSCAYQFPRTRQTWGSIRA